MDALDYITLAFGLVTLAVLAAYGIGCVLYAIVLLGKGIEAMFARFQR